MFINEIKSKSSDKPHMHENTVAEVYEVGIVSSTTTKNGVSSFILPS